jgi:hypothetical protein
LTVQVELGHKARGVLGHSRGRFGGKKIMKNMGVVVLLAAIALVGTLVACGGSDTTPAKSPDNSASAPAAGSSAPATDTSTSTSTAPK